MRFYYLSICCLHNQTFASVQDARSAKFCGGSTKATVNAMACCFHSYQLHRGLINKMIESARRITASANTCDYMSRRIGTGFFKKLLPDLLADHALKPRHHIRIRVRTYHTAYYIMRIHRVIDPVAKSFIG